MFTFFVFGLFFSTSSRPLVRKIKITVVAADDLIKREVFKLPDPVAFVHIYSPRGTLIESKQTNS